MIAVIFEVLPSAAGRDEAAVAGWRALPAHAQAQAAGRSGMFADYRLRVAQVLRDYGLNERAEARVDSRMRHGHSL